MDERLKKLRKKLDLTQREFAEKLQSSRIPLLLMKWGESFPAIQLLPEFVENLM